MYSRTGRPRRVRSRAKPVYQPAQCLQYAREFVSMSAVDGDSPATMAQVMPPPSEGSQSTDQPREGSPELGIDALWLIVERHAEALAITSPDGVIRYLNPAAA